MCPLLWSYKASKKVILARNKRSPVEKKILTIPTPEIEPGPRWWEARWLPTEPAGQLRNHAGLVVVTLIWTPVCHVTLRQLPSKLTISILITRHVHVWRSIDLHNWGSLLLTYLTVQACIAWGTHAVVTIDPVHTGSAMLARIARTLVYVWDTSTGTTLHKFSKWPLRWNKPWKC